MNSPVEVDPLLELWLRMRRVLAPYGVRVDAEHLSLWRDQAAHGYGPLRAAENGDARAVQELIALLRLLTGAPQDGAEPGVSR